MLPSQFRFVASAYNTAQAMIRFADEKAEMLFVVYGILMGLMSFRVDVVVRVLRSPARFTPLALVTFLLFCAFLGIMFVGLSFAVTTMHPRFAPAGQGGAGDRRRLYWYRDVLAKDREAYLAAVRDLGDEDALAEMAHELYDAQAIERAKFADISKATRISGWGLGLWLLTLILSFVV